MKKHISIALTVAVMMVVAFGCKVGADDPASMASRDGRLIRTWKLTNVEGLSTDVNTLGTSSESTSYNGTILTIVSSPGGTATQSYSLELVIDKAGVITITEVIDGSTDITTTNWEWLNNDKNKSELLASCGQFGGGPWTVTRLSSKDLVLSQYGKDVFTTTGYSSTSEDAWTLTFSAE